MDGMMTDGSCYATTWNLSFYKLNQMFSQDCVGTDWAGLTLHSLSRQLCCTKNDTFIIDVSTKSLGSPEYSPALLHPQLEGVISTE